MLLKGKIPVYCNERVEAGLCEREELAVFYSGPPGLWDRRYFVARNVSRKTSLTYSPA